MASSSERLKGAEAAPVGVLPLNCPKSGTSVQNSVENVLNTVNLCLIPM